MLYATEHPRRAELEQQVQSPKGRGAAPAQRLAAAPEGGPAARGAQQRFETDLAVHLVPAQELAAQIRQQRCQRVNAKVRRMKPQDNVRAVVVKEVQLRDPVLTGALCTAAPAPAPAQAPVALLP